MVVKTIGHADSLLAAKRVLARSQRGHQTNAEAESMGGNVYVEADAKYSTLWGSANVAELMPKVVPRGVLPPSIFTVDVVKKTRLSYSSAKSAGQDNFHMVILKTLATSCQFMEDLVALYTLFYTTSCTPAAWDIGLTHLVVKGKSNARVDNTRPISLTSVFRRIFESVLHSKWASEQWAQLHPAQAGCRRGFSTMSQVLVNDHLSQTGYKYSCLLDIQKAFDTINHAILIQMLIDVGAPSNTVQVIVSMFGSNMQTGLIVNGRLGNNLLIKTGLFLGSILSPLLFNLYVNNLAKRLDQATKQTTRQTSHRPNRIHTLFYVDDILLKAKSGQNLQNQLNIASQWSTEHGLIFNVQKCVVLNTQKLKAVFTLGGVALRYSDTG
jgi:hypothetical protein